MRPNLAPKKLAPLFVMAATLLLAFAAYRPALDGPFLLDDTPSLFPYATDNLAWEEISETVLTGRFGGFSRSLTKITFVLTHFTSGRDPFAFKYQNLMLHLINALLVFWLVSLLIQAVQRKDSLNEVNLWPGVLAASLWLLHPLQVSTVA
jgi:hypothetical protein